MRTTNKALYLTAIASLLASHLAFSATPVSDAYSPGESDSKWILGLAIAWWKNPYINEADEPNSNFDDGEFDGALIPRIEYRGERFFVDSDGVGVTLLRSNGFSTGLILSGEDSYLEDKDHYDDNDRLIGIKERESTLNIGAYLLHNQGDGQFKLSLWQEVTNEHHGQSADLHYTYNFPIGRWNITPIVGAEWVSDKNINHFYGVSESESLASNDIAVYKGKSSTNVYGGISARFDINDHWDLQFGAGYVAYGSGIKDSPLIKDANTFVSGFGVNYNF